MWGAIASAAIQLGSSIYGGIKNAQARKKQERMLAQQLKDNQAWYDRKYNEDPTKRADTVRFLTQMQEQIKNRNQAAKGRQAVMGGTEDSTTAVKEANNKTLADSTSQIVAANESRKDTIEQQYLRNKQAIQNQQYQNEADNASNTASVVQGIAGTAANIAGALDSGSTSKSSVSRPTTSSPTASEMQSLDAKAGAAPTQSEVASDVSAMVGGNAPRKRV